ncbi:hypothetical protein V6N13_048193 [Hibiscus sabdariffa]|uniref:Uncharacterized protein n=1 Tax=Hibiscus sabdariffa TaxID=183260 RepID=A0ABR2F6I5_9ROSI
MLFFAFVSPDPFISGEYETSRRMISLLLDGLQIIVRVTKVGFFTFEECIGLEVGDADGRAFLSFNVGCDSSVLSIGSKISYTTTGLVRYRAGFTHFELVTTYARILGIPMSSLKKYYPHSMNEYVALSLGNRITMVEVSLQNLGSSVFPEFSGIITGRQMSNKGQALYLVRLYA